MSTVSVREFSYNPSAMFARVEQGETIEVTRHGSVIAVLLPGSGTLSRYATLVAKGTIRLKSTTTSDIHRLPRYDVPPDVSPLDLLLSDREDDER
ncbi:type II toxin-antitoxin system Phd/YefM family antitoxin [Micromonospora sp. NPDC047812]|uniref:type II toxin-antitoxin system Phd/YefM family antitoxin n=1 Tax=Micromonospora sp. NPDC047812 TaxID=3155742 RepID=UPI0034557FD0